MSGFNKEFFLKITETLSFKSAIAKKFSIYIVALIAVIIIFLVISVKSQEKVFKDNFEHSIKFTSGIIGESVKNAFIIQYYTFLNPLIDSLTDEEEIVYVIILSEDNRVMETSIDSYASKHISELGDNFSSEAANDTVMTLRQEQAPFIRRKLQNDFLNVTKEINEYRTKYYDLRLIFTLKQVHEKIKSTLDEQRRLEAQIENLSIELTQAPVNAEQSKILINRIKEKNTELKNIKDFLSPLEKIGKLIEKRDKKEALLKKMEENNTIYEVSVPMIGTDGEKYGTIRIGYSPKTANTIINKIYSDSIITGIVFIFIGLLISLFLARLITKPVEELARGAEILGSGNLYYRIILKTGDEMEFLADSLNNMAGKLNESYSSLEQKVQERTREYLDATKELQKAYRKLQTTQTQLVQSEKMTSLGQLVAGVAHELNNPIGFIYSNIGPLEESINTITNLIELFQKLDLKEKDREKIEKFIKENDFEFIIDDLSFLIKDIKEGAERSHKIILDLKNFSRLDEAEYKEVDIHQGINSTLNLLANQYKHKVTAHKDYGKIPLINCYASQLNQVWMNLLVNASQAIQEKGDVWIKTELEDENVVITIKDNGQGIKKEVLERIFDPFFTTKPVGHGTGLGLSITHSIIKKHNGTIEVESYINQGTTFIIKLPINRNNKNGTEQPENEDMDS